MINKIKVGSDFSGVGAFNQALQRLGIEYDEIFACDQDKYARQTFTLNFGEPKYYPTDVYDREIPKESLDIYMSSPPCFTGETLVNTKNGFKMIQELRIGESVLTHENRFRGITDFGSKESKIWKLSAQGIVETSTTQNHRYLTRLKYREWNSERKCDERKFTDPKWVEVKDLTRDHFIGINIPTIEENPYNIDKDKAYLFGRYVADGWLRDRTDETGRTSGNSIVIAIGKDKVDTISEKIKFNHHLAKEVSGVRKMFIGSNSLVALIKELGLGKGAINKRIPQSIINLPKDILQSFVDGYMDGDGHKNKDSFRATSVSKELLMGLQLCVAKLYRVNANIKFVKTPDTTVIEGRTVNQRDYYVLEFRLEMRKQSNAKVIGDVIWYPVRNVIETNETETVYDITVDEDHSFTANQAIVHNCQAFSLAGKRKGEEDKRGILFYNTHEFIQKNNPRYFIIENVKGLLSDDSGKTFARWIDLLGGKSVNGNPILFPHEDSTPYHVYYQVLNAKHYGVPQNRERIFIIGVRDDADNNFSFPKPFPLIKRLKDVLESEVDEKYFLSDKMIDVLTKHQNKIIENENPKESATIHAGYFKMGGRDQQYLKIKSATKSGYEVATENDSINFSVPNSETRRGRVGKGVAQTLDTAYNQAVLIGAIRGRNPQNPLSRVSGLPTEQMLEINESGTSNALTTVQKDNAVVYSGIAVHPFSKKLEFNGFKDTECPTLLATDYKAPKCIEYSNQRIRRLTPTECMKLMSFNEDFIERTINSKLISDSQLYKQCGNSIVVGVLAVLIKNLNGIVIPPLRKEKK